MAFLPQFCAGSTHLLLPLQVLQELSVQHRLPLAWMLQRCRDRHGQHADVMVELFMNNLLKREVIMERFPTPSKNDIIICVQTDSRPVRAIRESFFSP